MTSRHRLTFSLAATLLFAITTPAQGPIYDSLDPLTKISVDLQLISGNVQKLSDRLKEFVDKFEKVGGLTLSEKQQRLIFGLELLVRTEERVATQQKFQIELTERLGMTRAKLAQVERDLRPENIERSVAMEGTTRAQELRDSRRAVLMAERSTLTDTISQILNSLNETNDALREAQAMAARLRRAFLPEIERELLYP